MLQYADSLVLCFQFIHDGYLSHWFGVNDLDANSKKWLCKVCSGRWWSGNFGDNNWTLSFSSLRKVLLSENSCSPCFHICSQERDVSEESGWKLVHGDVFRPPWSLVLLSAVVGTGAQLALLVLLVILLAIVGTLYVGYVEKLVWIQNSWELWTYIFIPLPLLDTTFMHIKSSINAWSSWWDPPFWWLLFYEPFFCIALSSLTLVFYLSPHF